MKITDAVQEYVVALQAQQKSALTVYNYQTDLKQFAGYWDNKDVETVTQVIILDGML